ncbi:uncharacterized protein B0I36DRAFT_246329 [Microdochium trichocladiopsis]|uniref:Uncharacterized protein n=1 Tax=Microdochium trichocladiopsis TaxID=1682393 RepID=A0A9P8Y165_9PEZI|nr:uncharacterized protein B0I36DRAFT_246329 [Microdochium trichocladiopsis]KAH7027988.1 hypothetical protein B0I36DRAFT_246329 [Microdochium trichocladiopsis]
MCFYDQKTWGCGYWKWAGFRQQCPKEYRTGETCGLKLVYESTIVGAQCKVCDAIDKKKRKYQKKTNDMARWKDDPAQWANYETAEADAAKIYDEWTQLIAEHNEVTMVRRRRD